MNEHFSFPLLRADYVVPKCSLPLNLLRKAFHKLGLCGGVARRQAVVIESYKKLVCHKLFWRQGKHVEDVTLVRWEQNETFWSTCKYVSERKTLNALFARGNMLLKVIFLSSTETGKLDGVEYRRRLETGAEAQHTTRVQKNDVSRCVFIQLWIFGISSTECDRTSVLS